MSLPAKQKLITGFIIGTITVTGILATKPPQQEEPYTNLKILSKNLTDDQMDHIMHRFCSDLGVTCAYCHIRKKDAPYPQPMDFASDDKPEKIQARKMLAMSMKLNKKYFNIRIDNKISIKPKIWCFTCHHGVLIDLKRPYNPVPPAPVISPR
jgi:hypothetical protein